MQVIKYDHPVYVRYTRVFAVGGGHHRIDIYADYQDDAGLNDLLFERKSTRASDLFKHVRLPQKQIETLRELAKEKTDGIAMPDGSIKSH